ncbi:MAG: basic rane protein [Gaiellales bacterium]|jgi:basic membrane protein A|nr:basic rane protein [Gaiellales bacterium]
MSRRMGVLALTMAVAAALSALTAATAGARQSAAFKAAWIYVGPAADHGWSQAHNDGRLYVQKMLGSKVQTTYKENVPEGPQTSQVIDSLVRDGNKIIFATSFGYQPAMVAAAKKYPNVIFEQATGYILSKNLGQYYGAGEDAIYLSGMAAGAASKNGVVGYVVPFALPEMIRHANAFALGAQATHPGAKVKLVWTKSWLAADKEKKAAESLHTSGGADVLGQNVDSPATGQYAESVGIPWVGYDSDAQSFAPKSWLTAAVYHWGYFYLKQVKAAMAGTWKSSSYWGGWKDKFIDLAPFGAGVSAKTKAAIGAKKAAMLKGSFYEFQGPIYDQSGKLRVPKGQKLSLKDILGMNWLVKGVIGSPKG